MNRTVLVGRLTKDPELRHTQTNKAVASFTIAVNRNFKNANGDYEADFINIVAWGQTAEIVKQYAFKGHRIGIDGRMQTRNYQKDHPTGQGERVYVTEVVAESVELLEPKRTETTNTNEQIQNRQQPPQQKKEDDPFTGLGDGTDENNSLPF